MKKNIGTIDKFIRMIIVLTVVVLYYSSILTGAFVIPSLIVAGVITLTIYTNFCPLYALLHLHTDNREMHGY